jgi:predicted ATPase
MALPAYEEAANQLNFALDLISQMCEPEAWSERELEIVVQLAQILMAKHGYVSEASNQAFARAAVMIDATQNMELRMAIYYGSWIGPYLRAEHEAGLALTTKFVDEADRRDAAIPRLIAHRMRAATLIALGRPAEALDHLDVSFGLYQQDQNPDFASRFAQEPGVQIKCYQLLGLWMAGYADQALAIAAQATDTARKLQHSNTICYAALHHALLAMWCHDDDLLKEINDESLNVATEHGMSFWLSFGAFFDELLKSRRGDKGAMGRLQAAFDVAEQAKEFLRLGKVAQASDTVRAALDLAESSSERWTLAELFRIEGEIRLAGEKREDAAASFQRAIEVASRQGAKSLELRATTSLARLWAGQGNGAQAREVLQPVYDWFTEGFETADLKDAKALLDRLA